MPRAPRPIVFLSDFGLGNEWVGICHSVLAAISPRSPIVDLTHLIRPLEVQSGALVLADSMPYIPRMRSSSASSTRPWGKTGRSRSERGPPSTPRR
jgi:S-adenosyl-l-methionine hydroxide adenosyltransferase